MKRLTYSYALITALYDEGQDYLDAFWPFVVKAFPGAGRVDRGTLKAMLAKDHGLEIPSHALRLLLYRARRKGLIKKVASKRLFYLTDEGRNYKDELETDREVERRINELLSDGVSFFSDHGVNIAQEALSELLLSFLQTNLDPLLEYVGSEATCESEYDGTGEHERLLISFIRTCEEESPAVFSTLMDMLRGSILSTVICSDRAEKFEELQEADLAGVVVYLDTNFLLAVLGFEVDELVDAAAELMELVKSADCTVRVFPFTVDEICAFFSAYSSHEHEYSVDVAVRSAFSAMKQASIRRSEVLELINGIEERIREAGIQLDSEPEIDLEAYTPSDARILTILRRYKHAGPRVENHDMAAIETIRSKRRGKRAHKLQDARALFLSSDVRLSRASFEGLGHKRAGTVAEVIHDNILASILWLRSPSASPPLKSIVAAHSRNLFVEKRVWERFLRVVHQLKERGEVQEDDIADLLYRDYISTVLMDMDVESLGRLDRGFVLAEIEKAKAAREAREVQNMEALKAEHKAELRSLGQSIEEAWKLQLAAALSAIEDDCNLLANRATTAVCSLVTVLYLAVVGLLSLKIARVPLAPWASGLSFAGAVLAPGSLLVPLWGRFREAVKNHLAKRLFERARKRSYLGRIADFRIEANEDLRRARS